MERLYYFWVDLDRFSSKIGVNLVVKSRVS